MYSILRKSFLLVSIVIISQLFFFFSKGLNFPSDISYYNIAVLPGNCHQYLFFRKKSLKKKASWSTPTQPISLLLNIRGSFLTSTDFSFKDGNSFQ